MACAAHGRALLITVLRHGPDIASAHLWKTTSSGSSHQMQKNWISFLSMMAEAESLLSSVGELWQQCTSAEFSAGQLSLEGGKSLSGEIKATAGKAQFKLYCCVDVRRFWFPNWAGQWSPLLSQALAAALRKESAAETQMGRAGWWGPGVHRVLAIAPGSSSPPGGAWLAPSLQPQRAKKPWQARLELLQSKHWEKQTTLRALPRCQCLNLVASFRSINLFQKWWKCQLENLSMLWRALLRAVLSV